MDGIETEVATKNGDLVVEYRDPQTLHVSATYQVLDPLSQEELEALRQDVKARGIQVPVDIDQDGTILDGHNRVAIAKELGSPCPVIVHAYDTEVDRFEHAVKANLLRRQVSQIAWAKGMQRLLDAKGIKRNAKRNRFTDRDDTLSALYGEVGVNERTAQRRFELFDALEPYPDLVREVDTGTMSVAKAKNEARKRQGKDKTEKPKKVGTIEELTAVITRAVEQYVLRHAGFKAQVHQKGQQVIVDVVKGAEDTSDNTEKFPLAGEDVQDTETPPRAPASSEERKEVSRLLQLIREGHETYQALEEHSGLNKETIKSCLLKREDIIAERRGRGGKIYLRLVQANNANEDTVAQDGQSIPVYEKH